MKIYLLISVSEREENNEIVDENLRKRFIAKTASLVREVIICTKDGKDHYVQFRISEK